MSACLNLSISEDERLIKTLVIIEVRSLFFINAKDSLFLSVFNSVTKFAISEIENFKKTFLENKMTWQEKFMSLKQETTDSFLYAGLPMFATSTIASLHGKGVYDLTELSKGLFLTGVATIATTGKELRKRWTAKKSNYYLEIGKYLNSKENSTIRLQNMATRLNEFVND